MSNLLFFRPESAIRCNSHGGGTMCRILRLLFCVVLTIGLGAVARAQTDTKNAELRGFGLVQQPMATVVPGGDYYALVIGIDKYPVTLNALKTASSDAESVADILANKYNFRVQMLLDDKATRLNILGSIIAYQQILKDDDSLLIYFAGHGWENPDSHNAYWLPVDADSVNSPNKIIADDLTSDISSLPARHVLVISDSCYSGGMRDPDGYLPPDPVDRKAFVQKMQNRRSRNLMSSGGKEPVSDAGTDGHSVFAYALLQALDRMPGDVFTASDLFYGFIRVTVSGKANQTPEYDSLHNSNHEGGDFIFTRKGLSFDEQRKQLDKLESAYEAGDWFYRARRYTEAVAPLARACDAGSSRACQTLGNMYANGQGVPQDYKKASEIYQKAFDLKVQ